MSMLCDRYIVCYNKKIKESSAIFGVVAARADAVVAARRR